MYHTRGVSSAGAHGAGSALCEALAAAIQVSERRQPDGKEAVVVEGAGEASLRSRDLLVRLDRAGGGPDERLQEDDPHRAAVGAAVVVRISAHRKGGAATAVQIAERRHTHAEGVPVAEPAGEAALRVREFDVRHDRPVRVEE